MKLIVVLLVFFCSGYIEGASHHLPGFDFSMRSDTRYQRNVKRYPQEWQRVKELFQHYLQRKACIKFAKEPYRIPKKIHLIWLGSPPPDFVRRMCESWRVMHLGWEVKLWNSEDVEDFHLKNKAAYDRSGNWGEKSDIVRYEILEREGGLYVDTDFECLKPFDDIAKSADCFFGLAYSEGAPHYNNALIGCRPHHPILRQCVESIRSGNGDNDFARILQTTGPHFFTSCLNTCLWPTHGQTTPVDMGIVVPFPVAYFYPFPDARRGDYQSIEAVKQDWIHPETYAIHYWCVSWLPHWGVLPMHDTKQAFPEIEITNQKRKSHSHQEELHILEGQASASGRSVRRQSGEIGKSRVYRR